jgi:transposase
LQSVLSDSIEVFDFVVRYNILQWTKGGFARSSTATDSQNGETACRLMSIPGLGPITASAWRRPFRIRQASPARASSQAFLRLTPTQNSSGGKPKLGRISKMGNRNLRKLLIVGAHAVLFHHKAISDPLRMWAKKLIEKEAFRLVAAALANNMARIAFAIMRGKTVYREIPA